MASANTNKTIWTLAIIAVLVFLAWKLWPAIKNAISNSGSGGGGAVGSTTASGWPYDPYSSSGQGSGPGLSLGSGLGSGNGSSSYGSNTVNPLTSWINSIFSQGQYDASGMNTDDDLEQIDENGLPLEPLQNMPLQSWTQDDPNAPWNEDDEDLDPTAYVDTISDSGADYLDDGSDGGGGGDQDLTLQGQSY